MTLIMSVSGVRGLVGKTMTPILAAELGAAWGSHLGGGSVVVGRDSRPSGSMLQCGLVSGLMACGCEAIDLGIVSTPGTALMIRETGAAGGVVLTASHNPAEWNGVKFLTAQGCAPPPEDAEKVFARYRARDFAYKDHTGVGRRRNDDSTHERHVGRVLSVVDVDRIRQRRVRVVLDSVNGAGGLGGRLLLERLGCEVFHINAEANGRFAHTPEPTAENLVDLCDVVLKHRADVGFAQDPDADRLAIVDNTGRYIGEEYTVALAGKHLLAKRPGPIAVNLSTSRMIDDLAAAAGATVYRTAVGEANVAAAMIAHGCILGGEGNGGVIDPRIIAVRDSFAGMALVLELLAYDSRPLNQIVDDIPAYVMLKRKYDLSRERIDAWLARMRGSADGHVNNSDGIRIDWPQGWVHLRASNTEPIARVIAEAADARTATALVDRVVHWMPA